MNVDPKGIVGPRWRTALAGLFLGLAYVGVALWCFEVRMFFLIPALLPAVVGLIDQQAARNRYDTQRLILNEYFDWLRKQQVTTNGFNPLAATGSGELDTQRPSFLARLGAVLVLSTILALPTTLLATPDTLGAPARGIAWAGAGALLYVLWALVGRLSVNALSTRFFLNASLRVASTLVAGYAAMVSMISQFSPV